jgi:tetratricopeptide (TPR) repeat protein/transcriptional regulator with XRE-family HTH domain
MATPQSGPDAAKVCTIADLVRELDLLRARAAHGRHQARVSLTELASLVGVPRSTVHAYVTGRHLPPATVLDRIVIALGATPPEQRQWSEAWFRVTADRGSTRRVTRVPGAVATSPVPHQLPPDVADYCGRRLELGELDRLRTGGSPMVVIALTGGGGIGKTALAVHWAHRVMDEFPDGQLWVDLRGFDPAAPLDPGVALTGFLRALGVPESGIPADVAERATLYRTVLSGRRVLVLLDNASDAEQVRHLLPGTPHCVVVITSRDRLTGLVARHGARRIELGVLPDPDALALLRGLIGARVDADPEAAAALVERCAALPLALRLTAELAAARPSAALRGLADEQRLLDLLDGGGDPRTAIRTVFSWSTRQLRDEAYTAFRRLGLHPGPSFDVPALAALLDADLDQTSTILAELARIYLVQYAGPDRYHMHDLVLAWAADRGEQVDSGADRAAALDRLADYYLSGATAAMDLLYPHEKHRRPSMDGVAVVPPDFDGGAAAGGWLEQETEAMLAIAARVRHRTIAFAMTLRRHLETTSRYAGAQRLHEQALVAARCSGDPAAQAGCLVNLSAVYARTGQLTVAAQHLYRAVELCRREVGDPAELARALDDLGTVHGRTGRFAAAAGNFAESLALCRQLGDTDGEARALHNLGTVHGITGDYQAAESCFRDALGLCRGLGDPLGEAYAIDNLGSVYCRMARYAESVACHERALALRRERGDRLGTAHALDHLGTTYRAMGEYRRALSRHQESLTLRRDIGDVGDEPHALNNLGATRSLLDQPDQAIPYHHLALAQCRRSGNRYEEARAHEGLGVAYRARGERDQARQHWRDALATFDELDVPEAAGVRARLAEPG